MNRATAKKQNIKDNSPDKTFLKEVLSFMELQIINKQPIPKLQAATTSAVPLTRSNVSLEASPAIVSTEKMISGDVVQEKAEITKIHKFEFLSADVAMCVFTLGAKFSYKGTPNDDLPTVTSIFKKIDGIWKIHWMQRSSGDSDLSLWD